MDLKTLDEMLTHYIKPLTFPLAIKMLAANEKPPEIAKTIQSLSGEPDMLCKFVTASRRYGWIMFCGKEDNFCPMAMTNFGFYPLSPAWLEGEDQMPVPKTVKEDRAADRQALPKFDYGKYSGILIVPLSRINLIKSDFEPDVIVLFGFPSQVLILSEGLPHGELQGQVCGGACIGYIIRTMQTGKCHVVMPCGGERIAGGDQDWEIIFSMPFNKVDLVMEKMLITQKEGHKFPIPQQVVWESSVERFYPPSYRKARERLIEYKKELEKGNKK
jgi:uncharacterized protein (DUF169 family)